MKKALLLLSLLTLATAARPARAGDDAGLQLGLRAAYALPLGDAGDGAELRDLTPGAVPVQLEAGWRFDRHWLAGAYFAWGPSLVGDVAKDALAEAGASDVSGHFEQRVGLQGIYTFSPLSKLAPWVGLGLGYEWTRYADAKLPSGDETEVGLRGFEALLQVGGDYRVTSRLTVGPYATFSVGQYGSHVATVEGDSSTTDVEDRGIHEWVQLGFKGSFDL